MAGILESLAQDMRYGARTLRQSRAFAAVAALTLALGIGANTAIFSIVTTLLLRPLPFPDLDRIVNAWESRPQQRFGRYIVSPADFLDWRAQNGVFDHLAAYRSWRPSLTGSGAPEALRGFRVSPRFFPALGVRPILGRTFFPQEELPGEDNVVLVSHGLWQRRFGSSPRLLGETLSLDGVGFTVVGIMPPDFEFPYHTEIWAPLAFTPAERTQHGLHSLLVLGRLRSGVSLSQAEAEINTIARRLEQQYPDTNAGRRARLVLLREHASEVTGPFLLVSQGAAAFVLLIACANVANLLLVRAIGRHKEIALRAALGASRGRVLRQLLTESVLLSLLGGVGALLLAWEGVAFVKTSAPPNSSVLGWKQIELSGQALAFNLAISLLAGILFGLAPALQASKPDLNEALKEEGRGSTGGRGRHRVRRLLVVSEVALALALLVGAGLMVRGFGRLAHGYPGFNPEGLLTLRISLADSRYAEPRQITGFYERVLGGIRTLPEARSVAAISYLPASLRWNQDRFRVEGQPVLDPSDRPVADLQVISADYFRTMQIPVVKGRAFHEADAEDTLQVAVISESMARRIWPAGDPIGTRVRVGGGASESPWLTVVGIVRDVKQHPLDREPQPTLYRPFLQAPERSMNLTIRTSAEPTRLATAVRAEIVKVDPNQSIYELRTMEGTIRDAVAEVWIAASWMAALGVVALILSAVGVYGVMNYSVTQRTHEIGIRMALGARPGDITRAVVREASGMVAIGLAAGLAVAFALARGMSSLLPMVVAEAPIFGLFTAVLAGVALVSSYVPALRATRVDPMIVLRYE